MSATGSSRDPAADGGLAFVRGWRPLVLIALVALAGALGTLAAGAITGMPSTDLWNLTLMLIPAVLATVVAVAVARPLLARSSIRARMIAVAVIGAVVALANLAVLARLMFVSEHDLTFTAIALIYAVGAGIGAGIVIARSSTKTIDHLAETARSLGEGDLSARVGAVDGGPELDTLATTLDEMAAQLEAAIARERSVEQTRRDLMTAVSHDLRTPLASLRAMVEAIDDGIVEDPPSMRRYAGEMRTSVTALSTLVDDLFELAQLDAGAIERETARVRLKDAVASALATCEPEASRKGLELRTRLTGAGDALCSPRLERVLQNLVSNAIRHTPADGTVTVEAVRRSGALEVAVEDTGEGIPPEDLARVFDPFWRGDPARTGAGAGAGAGLGLTLARRITEALGGRIEAQTRAGSGGARFAVLVPESR